jgi:hypothetical protein
VTTVTTSTGAFRFPLLKPGAYTIKVTAPGFKETTTSTVVTVGQISTVTVQIAVGSTSETVEVTAQAQLLQPDSPELSTQFEFEQLQSVPNPGGDVTYVAQTAPGAVMNTGGGYGNFEVFGLPATSNNFTMNGMQVNDPFLNLNNSGPSNLLLGLNDVQEVNVVTNAYGVQYGSFGGAQVNAISRSGSNRLHGNANYWWNGRSMNANNWFNAGHPKPFANTNQWAAAAGFPIIKDHTFFFANYEGLSFITAPVSIVYMPSTSYETSVLGNNGNCTDASSSLYKAGTQAQCGFYKNIFNIYNNAPNHAAATPVVLPNGTLSNDQLQVTETPKTDLSEKLVNARLDQVFGDKDRLFIHFKWDHGVQPTYTDPFTPTFNVNSDQPDYEGQFSWTHLFSQNIVNQFLMTGSYYSAIFKMADQSAATALLPETLDFGALDGYFTNLNNLNFIFPQGRNATQVQFGDDLSYVTGKHTLHFGAAYKKDYVSDYDLTQFTTPLLVMCGSQGTCNDTVGINDNLFGSGVSLEAIQSFPLETHVPIDLYTLGIYGQDDWKPTTNLTLTMGVRVERNSNPYASKGSLSNFGTDFDTFVSNVGASNFFTTPYNKMIKSGLKNAFVNYQRAMVEPRLGFTYEPEFLKRTVIRGGAGFFTDVFPGTIADTELFNPPINPQFTIFLSGIDPKQSYSSAQAAASLNKTFQTQYAAGGSASTITAANPNFAPPNFTTVASHLQYPTYVEWNLQVQHELGKGNAFEVSYVGNHGYHEPVENAALNAFGGPPFPANPPTGSSPTASAFGTVTEVRSNAGSNYNGFIASFLHRGKSLNLQFNYTWSHALDEISNGGILPFSSGSSITSQINPYDLSHNYGNADYDIRHYFNGNYLYNLPHFGGPALLTGGWELSGVIFVHTGLPFTPSQTEFVAASGNVGGTGVAQVAPAPGTPHHCGSSAARKPCLQMSDFPAAGGAGPLFAPYDRNQFTGPGYFDTDMTLAKKFDLFEGIGLKLGITGYNLLNHPNFANPDSNALSSSSFGKSFGTVSPPTSIYGAFLGGDASVRIVQFTGKLTF